MTAKLIVAPTIEKGFRNDRLSFAIDNDSFPTLINAYNWRGRVKRKRGSSLLTRLQRYFNSTSTAYSSTTTILLDGAGSGNLLTGFGLETNGSIIPGSVTITGTFGVYTDPAQDGTLAPSGSINYGTGAITIAAEANQNVSLQMLYYPSLPVMGLEKFVINANQFTNDIAFDTVHSYFIPNTSPFTTYDVSFYKNPPSNAPYITKGTVTPTSWNGQDYQQFWTVTYQGALWATNGVPASSNLSNIGMQFSGSGDITVTAVPTATSITLQIANCPLVVGDFVFFNEWTNTDADTLNFQTGFVTACAPNTPPLALKTVTITLPNAALVSPAGAYTPGIVQYLTTRKDTTQDCIRWYDGDPTNGSASLPVLDGRLGWVNFTPPLSQRAAPIANELDQQYYLVGCKMIVNFKNYLLFLGPVVQTSSPNSQVYLQDTIVYSQIGTPYYTASFQGDPRNPTTITPLLTPLNYDASPAAFFDDSAGFGGNITAGIDEQIITAATNEDALIVGFNTTQTRLIYTGNDAVPFEFFLINNELGSSSTFSAINMDRGVITKGSRGYLITGQTETIRVDTEIPEQVFEVDLTQNGNERFTAARDYINEWIYFSYPSNSVDTAKSRFNNQTLLYNYRENSWAIFNESYTTYGDFSQRTGFTWGTVGQIFSTWAAWNQPWNASGSTLLQPVLIGGNSQGFVMMRETESTNEGKSLAIRSFSGNVVTCPNHCLNQGDYILITDCIGAVSSQVNNKVFSIDNVTQNTFTLNPSITTAAYVGGGLITRFYVPFIQTKQFPMAWSEGRKTRIGVQRYLFTKTAAAQIQLLLFLSQNSDDPYNDGVLLPDPGTSNSSLIYSTILYTCPESTNLGLTPANINLQTPTATQQAQIWHRKNTSLIGDTVQVGFTLSDTQMRTLTNGVPYYQIAEIELCSFIIDLSPSQMLV